MSTITEKNTVGAKPVGTNQVKTRHVDNDRLLFSATIKGHFSPMRESIRNGATFDLNTIQWLQSKLICGGLARNEGGDYIKIRNFLEAAKAAMTDTDVG